MLRLSPLVLPAVRLAGASFVLAAAPPVPVAAAASVVLFLTSFTVAHDASHSALGLPLRANRVLLSLAALPMLISGHAMRRMHAIHHARPLSAGDLEGDGARRSALGAIAGGPRNAIALRVAAFRRAPRGERIVQLVESLGGVVLASLLACSGRPALVTYALVALVMQLTMAFWASHIPHNAPAWAIAASRRLAFLRSPVLLSLAFHDLHHQRPRVPCKDLASVERHLDSGPRVL